MSSRASWSVEDLNPSVRERAEAAARRAGMSVSDWLAATMGDAEPAPATAAPGAAPAVAAQASRHAPLPAQDAKDVSNIHQRLDTITRQIEHMSQPAARGETGVARQLNDAISRLDARLSQITEPAAPPAPHPAARQAMPTILNAPPLNPGSLELAIAEITARQNELDVGTARHPRAPSAAAGPMPHYAPAPDLSGLERQLSKITTKIDALQRPEVIEQSIAAFRGELAEIRHTITEAMPRRAMESLESEIRLLSRRIDDTRQSGGDVPALAGVERALNDIRETLRSLTPAEQLAGFDDAIRSLGGKIDLILRASGDPGTLEQLEGAIAALRAIVSNVASNEALARLGGDVQTLSAKLDQFSQMSRSGDFGGSLVALEERIASLTSTLRQRDLTGETGPNPVEGALRALSDRLDHLSVGNGGSPAVTHLEQRVSHLLERLDTSTDTGNLGRVEEGLQDIRRHLERQSASFAGLADPGHPAGAGMDPGLVEAIKRQLADMRSDQTESVRHTQDSLEVVNNTLGHVVDRLAMIEGDLRAARAVQGGGQPYAPAIHDAPRPELPNPAASQPARAQAVATPPAKPSNAIRDILDLHNGADTRGAAPTMAEPRQPQAHPRPAIDPNLPPDHPLEPGTRSNARVAAPPEQYMGSDHAVDDTPPSAPEPAGTASFIAAARRAAQAAASAAPANDKGKRSAPAAAGTSAGSTITTRIRSLLVGASVVVIVLGSFKMAMNLLEGAAPSATEAPAENSRLMPPAEIPARPTTQAPPAAPATAVPAPIGRQSLIAPLPNSSPSSDLFTGAFASVPALDITGSIPPAQAAAVSLGFPATGRKLTQISIPPNEKLPETIGGAVLRNAALAGDPAAAYEIGVRFAEGRGVAANYDEAAKWYDRAAQAGIVPAIFRLGTLYEKGLSVKRDFDTARRYYTLAAERGNAKAMHNLAVLDADGGAAGANYKTASRWFRKAADRGVADSQYNLGILYARGIGVEQNLAESYKWFSLAAAQGDVDSTAKRDDVAKKLDPQSLAASKLAIQTFTPEPQPDDATSVAAPAGGWDTPMAQTASAKPAKRASALR